VTTALKAFRVAVNLLGGLAESFWVPRLSKPRRDTRIQLFARRMLKALGIQLRVVGAPEPAGPVLLVANHISWLDILVLHAVCHCRFVAKTNVKRWPLIGRLATAAGTFYVDRESRRDARRIVELVTSALKDGEMIAVFPEGTTGNGRTVLPFHASLIEGAILADAPAQAVALQFIDGHGELCGTVSYLAADSLVGSIWRTMRLQNVCAVVTFGRRQPAGGRNRRALAEDLRREIMAIVDPPPTVHASATPHALHDEAAPDPGVARG
jgi:1-acyl-sn-glycerol-3-phosphate acyltransferase